jgi:DNA-binding NtrC family response regulator
MSIPPEPQSAPARDSWGRIPDSEPVSSSATGSGRPGHTPGDPRSGVASDGASLAAIPYADAKKRAVADFNETYVGALLRASQGNLSEAARRAGLDRSNFRRLLRSTSLDPKTRDE